MKQGSDGIKIYPMPVKDILNIELSTHTDIFSLELINITGKVLQSRSINTSLKTKAVKSMDLSRLDSGLYFLKLNGKKGVATKKIIIN